MLGNTAAKLDPTSAHMWTIFSASTPQWEKQPNINYTNNIIIFEYFFMYSTIFNKKLYYFLTKGIDG
jgi:hypothetical protein